MAIRLYYPSGEDIRPGDKITYHEDAGSVLFVVAEKTGDAAMDWHLSQYPGGGAMLNVNGWGDVFLHRTENEEDLILVSRKSS